MESKICTNTDIGVFGKRLFNSASAPLTCGAANEVPSDGPTFSSGFNPALLLELILTPGAAMHQYRAPPHLSEKPAMLLVWSVATTASHLPITCGCASGASANILCGFASVLLPAAKTTATSLSPTIVTIFDNIAGNSCRLPPQLLLIICAPLSMA